MQQDVMWTPWTGPGLEHLHLAQNNYEITADSIVIGLENNRPFRLWYEMQCDAGWRVREIGLLLLSSKEKGIKMLSDGEGHWTDISGKPILSLDGCIDIDITATPFTNTLPIRRLSFQSGESSELSVAYIIVPEMEVRPVKQRYTCLEVSAQGGLYRYEGLGTGFTAELPVDAEGLVMDYPGIFRRVWSNY